MKVNIWKINFSGKKSLIQIEYLIKSPLSIQFVLFFCLFQINLTFLSEDRGKIKAPNLGFLDSRFSLLASFCALAGTGNSTITERYDILEQKSRLS